MTDDQKVGEGGFGTVYRGRWNKLDVAVKMIPGRIPKKEVCFFMS